MYVMADFWESVPNSVKPKPCHDKNRIYNGNLCFVNAKYKVEDEIRDVITACNALHKKLEATVT